MSRYANNPRRDRQEQRILDALAEKPITYLQLMEHLHMAQSSVSKYLSRLSTSPRRIRISGYDRTNGRPLNLWSIGTGKDAKFVRKNDLPRLSRIEVQVKAAYALLAKPMTSVELQQAMNRGQSAIQKYLQALRADKKVHIHSWRELGRQGDHSPVYGRGNRPDAKKPRKSKQQIWQEVLADPDKHEYQKARKRMLWRLAAARRKPQNIFSALGL